MNLLVKAVLFVLGLAFLPVNCRAEEPIEVSVCNVLRDPAAYNHKLIRVRADVSRGFEDFTLSDQGCKDQSIWLELGGETGSQVMYCCGVTTDPKRSQALTVEGIPTTLLKDSKFGQFQKLTLGKEGQGNAKATIVGRYYSGKKQTFPGGTFWVGYGHMGFYSLLVIQQIVAVDKS